MHELLQFTLLKLACNPGENMLQLLVHPDSISYVLLRESPADDILNEPRRKPLSSLEGPRAKPGPAASCSTPPLSLTGRRKEAGRPMRRPKGRPSRQEVGRPGADPVAGERP